MKNQKTAKAFATAKNSKRVRFYVWVYFALVMTVLAPISPVHAPMLSGSTAEAVEPDYKSYASSIAWSEYGWDEKQFVCLDNIWTKESHWNPLADNPKSTAFGIAQMLKEDSLDGYEQIRNGLRYIEHRYQTPCDAWKFWKRNNWY